MSIASNGLDRWAGVCGFAVLDDAISPAARGYIDHVVVGSTGVALIDVQENGTRGRSRERLRSEVESVERLLKETGLEVPVRGYVCVNGSGRTTGDVVVRVDELYEGTPEAIGRSVGHGNAVRRDEAEAALQALIGTLRPATVRPLGDLVPRPPVPALAPPKPGRPGHPRTRSARRRLPHPSARRRVLIHGTALFLTILAVGSWLRNDSSTAQPTSVDNMLPALRERAEAAAGGPVRGPARAGLGDQVLVRFERGACRVVFAVSRSGGQTAATVPLDASRRCPG